MTVTFPGFDWTLPGGIGIASGSQSVQVPVGGGGTERQTAVAITEQYESALRALRDSYLRGNLSESLMRQQFVRLWIDYETEMRKLGSEGSRALNDRRPGGKYDWWVSWGLGQPTDDPRLTSAFVTTNGTVTTEQRTSIVPLIIIGALAFAATQS